MSALALSIRGLEKTYPRAERPALAGVNLDVPTGTAFGLIGRNGAGKTTLIKSILGVIRPSAGQVALLGRAPTETRVRRRVGYLPERLELPTHWTPIAYLKSIARIKRLASADNDIQRQLSRVELSAQSGLRLGTFSKGMKQRLGLAGALLGRPELLVLDEPTDGVDPMQRAAVREILKEEHARGATLFINSHLLAETEKICDRVGILELGEIVREERLDDLVRAGHRWRLRLQDPPPELASQLGLQSSEGGDWLLDAESVADLNMALDELRSRGVLIEEVRRDAPKLEDVLAESVGQS